MRDGVVDGGDLPREELGGVGDGRRERRAALVAEAKVEALLERQEEVDERRLDLEGRRRGIRGGCCAAALCFDCCRFPRFPRRPRCPFLLLLASAAAAAKRGEEREAVPPLLLRDGGSPPRRSDGELRERRGGLDVREVAVRREERADVLEELLWLCFFFEKEVRKNSTAAFFCFFFESLCFSF